MMSPGFNGAGLGNTGKDPRGEDLYGNNSFTYGDIFQRLAREDVQRLVGSAQASWRPFAWLQNDGTRRPRPREPHSYALCRFAECPDFSQWRSGQVSDRHRLDRNFSAKLTSNATWQATPVAEPQDHARRRLHESGERNTSASGTQLPPGGQSVGQAAVTTATATLPSADKTLGYYVQEQATLRDRLFLTVAVRTDQNSAFGTKFQSVMYPKVEPVVDRVGRVVLPAVQLPEPVPPPRARTARRACSRASTDAFVDVHGDRSVEHQRRRHAGPPRAVARQPDAQAGAHDRVRGRLRDARVEQPRRTSSSRTTARRPRTR